MGRDSGPVTPLEQKCIEPGHWRIEGRDVRAVFQDRSRDALSWNVTGLDGEKPPNPFLYLSDVRDWIRDQKQGE